MGGSSRGSKKRNQWTGMEGTREWYAPLLAPVSVTALRCPIRKAGVPDDWME